MKASANRNGLSYPVILLSAGIILSKNLTPVYIALRIIYLVSFTAIFPYFVINYLAVDFAMSELIDCYHLIRDWWNNES